MKRCRVCLTILILLNLTFQQALMGQPVPNHVVPMGELQNQLAAQSAQRLQDIQEIQELLNHDLVQREVGRVVDLERVELALATLDDESLNQLADESRKMNDQLQAGLSTGAKVAIIAGVAFGVVLIYFAAIKEYD